ncbi:MAG: pyridoxal phosphate-dependent aminotransferase [Desulfopila sp.]
MSISLKMQSFAEKSSWIRKMFEEGIKLKSQFGADNVFDFSIGNPDVPPPPEFNTALKKHAADQSPGVHAYMPNSGYPFVRQAIATRVSEEQQVAITGDEVLMTCGAAGAINVALKALLNPGEEVILLSPFFVDYHFYIDNHGGVAKVVNTDADFNIDLQAIEAALTDKTKALLINTPNNPTGQIYSAADLTALGQLLTEAGNRYGTAIYLVSDEPYRNIVFDGASVPSTFAAYTNSIIATSYSKELSLPGERIGYLAVHPQIADKRPLLTAMNMANRILGFINAPALMQRVVAELQNCSVDNSVYTRRKEIFCRILSEAGYAFQPPKGAFYIFAKTPIADDVEFCTILQQEKILAVPGRGFGMPGYIRLAFCVAETVITGATEGFARAMTRAKG